MSTRFLKRIEHLDAFPKIDPTFLKPTESGAVTTLLVGGLITILFFTQWIDYLTERHNYDFLVDFTIQKTLQVNIDLTIAMGCDEMALAFIDSSKTSQIISDPNLSLRTVNFANDFSDASNAYGWNYAGKFLSRWMQLPKEDNMGCRIKGSFDINRVEGKLQVVLVSHIHIHNDGMLHQVGPKNINFSHIIRELSFGQYYPGRKNPLDHTLELTTELRTSYQYFVNIVPTIYDGSRVLITNQYAVTNYTRVVDHDKGSHGIPGIFLRYDFDPISVRITKQRTSLISFLLNLCAILGGVYTCSGRLLEFVEYVLTVLKSKDNKL